jgi:hypothetical protein
MEKKEMPPKNIENWTFEIDGSSIDFSSDNLFYTEKENMKNFQPK